MHSVGEDTHGSTSGLPTLLLGLSTDAPAAAWLVAIAVGIALLHYRHPLKRLTLAHPFVPKRLRRLLEPPTLGVFWFFGVAFVLIGILGVIAALNG